MTRPTHPPSGQKPRFVSVAGIILLILALTTHARADEKASEYQIKAAFLYNFANFTTWPQGAFLDGTSPLVIGVLGEDPFNGHLSAVESKTVANGRPIRIARARALADLPVCHILFVSASENRRLLEIFEQFDNHAVLTIGDAPDACRQGTMISFFNEDNKVRFSVNLDAINESVLRLDSRVLKLGRAIDGRSE